MSTSTRPFWSVANLVRDPHVMGSPSVMLENINSGTGTLRSEISDSDVEKTGTPFKKGDVLFGKLRPYLAKSWHATWDGVAVGDIHVYRPYGNSYSQFLSFVVQSSDFLKYAENHSYGTKMPRCEWSSISRFQLADLTLETQQRIADYLDRETAEIDAAVADLDRYVELLEKRRRIIIADGLSDPAYRPVPQRLKFLTVSEDHRRIPIKSGDRATMSGEYPYYGASGIIDYVNDYLWDNEKRLLLSEDGANLVMRNHPVAFVADGQYWVNNHAHVLKCVGDTPPELIAMAIEITSIAHLITGSAQPKLTAAAMGEIEFLFPHSTDDQQALLENLKQELGEVDSLIADSTKLRELLLKRRSVLITEVVTGRKQV